MKVVGVNGRQFSLEELTRAIQNSKSNPSPISVLVSNSGVLETHDLIYHGGAAYPHLQRVQSVKDYLDDILKPLSGPSSANQKQ